jgi:hypothetical protein
MKNSKAPILLLDNSHFILSNIANYKPVLTNNINEIITKLTRVLSEYLRFIIEKLIIKKNKFYNKYIIERGLNTIFHIFSILLFYTKNLELSFYHSQKAFYLYVEFIEQISDDNVTFLQLSSKDAILFVYKKTIYEVNTDYKKNIPIPTNEEKTIFISLDAFLSIYKCIIKYMLLVPYDLNNKDNYIQQLCLEITNLSELFKKYKFKTKTFHLLLIFIQNINDPNIIMSDYFKLIHHFIKKMFDKKINIETSFQSIINNIYDIEFQKVLEINKNTHSNFINWIFN